MLKQKAFRLTVRPVPGESIAEFNFRQGDLSSRLKSQGQNSVSPQKLLCDLLKRHARLVMGDVNRCQPDTIAAHLARLESLCELSEHFIRHDFAETPESRLSGRQLAYPVTLADFVACMELTRRNHRCPEFVNPAEDFYREIISRLETIAFFVSQNPKTNTVEIEDLSNEKSD